MPEQVTMLRWTCAGCGRNELSDPDAGEMPYGFHIDAFHVDQLGGRPLKAWACRAVCIKPALLSSRARADGDLVGDGPGTDVPGRSSRRSTARSRPAGGAWKCACDAGFATKRGRDAHVRMMRDRHGHYVEEEA